MLLHQQIFFGNVQISVLPHTIKITVNKRSTDDHEVATGKGLLKGVELLIALFFLFFR